MTVASCDCAANRLVVKNSARKVTRELILVLYAAMRRPPWVRSGPKAGREVQLTACAATSPASADHDLHVDGLALDHLLRFPHGCLHRQQIGIKSFGGKDRRRPDGATDGGFHAQCAESNAPRSGIHQPDSAGYPGG